MNKLIPFLVLFLITACKTPCDDPKSLPSITSNFLIQHWECKNTEKVKADITGWMSKRNWCEESKGDRGILSGLVCGFIIEELRAYGADKVNKDLDWQCNPDLVGKDFAMTLEGLCSLIPF